MTAKKQISTSHVCSTVESKLKKFLVNKTLPQICFTDEDKPKGIIIDKYSTDEDESECVHKNMNKQKDANNEADYEESLVRVEVPSYLNIFECGENILDRRDVTYERACMANTKEKYYTKMLETLVDCNDRNNAP